MSSILTEGSRMVVEKWCLPACFLCAQTVTVAVHMDLANPADDTAAVDLRDVFAIMQWGSTGGECQVLNGCGPDCQEVEFDICTGAALSVMAWSLNVSVVYPGVAGQFPAIHPPIRVDVSVGIGTSGKAGIASSAQRTVPVGRIGAGGSSGVHKIPAWAVGAILVNSDPAVTNEILEQYPAPVAANAISRASIGKGSVDVVPIARGRGARYFDVLNNSASVSDDTAVIFCLAPN